MIDTNDADTARSVGLGRPCATSIASETATYHIVGSAEADPTEGRLSNESPVGRAMLGRKKGETVEVRRPGRRDQVQDRQASTFRRGVSGTPVRLTSPPTASPIGPRSPPSGSTAISTQAGRRGAIHGWRAGRWRAVHGKRGFVDVVDRTGCIQAIGETGEALVAAYRRAARRRLGVAARARRRSRRGEPTLRVEAVRAARPLRHGRCRTRATGSRTSRSATASAIST